MERWATFDCYGTLIDWNAGIRRVLADVFGEARADEQLERYHDIERTLEADGSRSYCEVMIEAMRQLGATEADAPKLGESLPAWQPFSEVRDALTDAHSRGWKLAILSNTDRDFIEASMERIGVPFALAVVASEIHSYKPNHAHWLHVFDETGASRERYVHVAQSHVHDIVPATELGLKTVWINRLGETREPAPTRELPDLRRLADTLDELV